MPSIIQLKSGATEKDISSALASLAQGGTLVLPKDETIRISKGLDIDTSKRDITLDLNGSTLKQAGDTSVINAGGSMAKASAVDLSFGSTNTTLTYAKAPSDVAVGDWIKVASDDALPHDNINTSAPTRLGQAMKVLSVDGDKVTLEGKPLYAELYKTNVRAAEIKSETFSLVNGTVEGDRSHPDWVDALVYVRNGIDTHIENLTVKDGNSMVMESLVPEYDLLGEVR
ncbi:hypothetical protein, partial [Methylobacterium sp. Leaf111]|uniref:hypothetical protein n=1 Tax=Methylobacterium sp. Leaf111 TaxID=1736257 RepID=UPI001AEC3D43